MLRKDNIKEEKVNNKKKLTTSFKFSILAIILIAVFSFAITPVTLQNDTFYTIKVGEHIQNYGVDGEEPFAWHEGLEYTYPHWLYDLITYWIYSGFGMQGIYIVTCVLSCILGISIYLVNRKLAKNDVLSFFITIGVMYLIKPYIAARAQLVTFILFIWTIYFIEMFLNTKKVRYALALGVIPILIANVHAAVWPFYFILFLPYIAEYIIAVIADIFIYQKIQMKYRKIRIVFLEKCKNLSPKHLEKLEILKQTQKQKSEQISKIKIRREQEKKRPYKLKIEKNPVTKWLIIIMLICVLTGLLTPIGDTPYTYLYKTMKGNTTQNINEHLPMTVADETGVLCVFAILFALLTFSKAKIKLSDLFMITGLAYLMISSRRQLTMFAIVGSIIFNRLFVSAFQQHDISLKKMAEYVLKPYTTVILIVIVGVMSVYFVKPKMDDEYISTSEYPVTACDFILNNVDLTTAKFYNEYNYGSYMLFRGIPVFIDSRADVYDPQFTGLEDDIFSDFINTSSIGTFYNDTFEKYGITHVITYKNSKMNMIITKTADSSLNQIYGDDNFVIYERVVAKE